MLRLVLLLPIMLSVKFAGRFSAQGSDLSSEGRHGGRLFLAERLRKTEGGREREGKRRLLIALKKMFRQSR